MSPGAEAQGRWVKDNAIGGWRRNWGFGTTTMETGSDLQDRPRMGHVFCLLRGGRVMVTLDDGSQVTMPVVELVDPRIGVL